MEDLREGVGDEEFNLLSRHRGEPCLGRLVDLIIFRDTGGKDLLYCGSGESVLRLSKASGGS